MLFRVDVSCCVNVRGGYTNAFDLLCVVQMITLVCTDSRSITSSVVRLRAQYARIWIVSDLCVVVHHAFLHMQADSK